MASLKCRPSKHQQKSQALSKPTPPKTNIISQEWRLEDYFPFEMVRFQVTCVHFREVVPTTENGKGGYPWDTEEALTVWL